MFRHRLSLITALVLLASAAPALAQNTLAFTASAAVQPNGSVISTLDWTTTPAAQSCAATGDWSGTKGGNGTEVQPATSSSKSYTLQCSWPGTSIVTFTWTPAPQNNDGSSYTNPDITRIKYTFGATAPTASDPCTAPFVCVDVDDKTTPRPSMRTVTGITDTGTLRAIAQHINLLGIPSVASNAVSKVFSAPIAVTQNVVVSFPAAPGSFSAN